MRTSLIRFILLLVLIILVNDVALTCPVCFGAAESARTRDSLNMAVIVLLGITGGVLSLFVTFFAYLRQRARMTLTKSLEYPNHN